MVEKLRGRRSESPHKLENFLKKKSNFHINDCQFQQRGDYTYVKEILPLTILKEEGLWHYKFLIWDLMNENRSFIFFNLPNGYFSFNGNVIDLSQENHKTKDNFLIIYTGYNFRSIF